MKEIRSKKAPKPTPLPLVPAGEIKLQKLPGDPNKPLTLVQSVLTNPLLAGISGSLLEPGAFLTAMTDYGPWDYKRKDDWQPTETYIDKNDGSRRYDGKNLDLDDQKNYIPWIYFDGYLIGADKFGNMNM